ncbi:MAG: type II toxin-antitoxin system RelE/ParE family toxin [Candidatus Aenigmarchaeota archaeon]|nr:type II toxin-antitoxin system RelE/ParE family toxin [Candidatus Aenigmarchaeota archaeon]
MFRIEFSRRAKKELKKLEKYKERIVEVLKILSLDPVPARYYDVKKLRGLKNAFRIRIGRIRIVYTINWKDKVIIIARAEFRGRAY